MKGAVACRAGGPARARVRIGQLIITDDEHLPVDSPKFSIDRRTDRFLSSYPSRLSILSGYRGFRVMAFDTNYRQESEHVISPITKKWS